MCFSPEPSTCGQAGRAPVPLGEDSLEGISSPTLEGCLQALWGGWPGILSQRGGGGGSGRPSVWCWPRRGLGAAETAGWGCRPGLQRRKLSPGHSCASHPQCRGPECAVTEEEARREWRPTRVTGAPWAKALASTVRCSGDLVRAHGVLRRRAGRKAAILILTVSGAGDQKPRRRAPSSEPRNLTRLEQLKRLRKTSLSTSQYCLHIRHSADFCIALVLGIFCSQLRSW